MQHCATAAVPATSAAAAHQDGVQLAANSHAPGLAIAVVRGKRMVWSDAIGAADIATNAPVTIDTDFRIGSVTKLLTATLFAKLVARGVVHLDDPASRYVPELTNANITLGQLAQHLSGIRHYGRSDYMNTQHYDGVSAALPKFINDPLVAAPGEKYTYSSYGYNLLGAALERATKTPFDELLAREVLRPFGMRHTFREPPANARVVKFYDRDDKGALSESPAVDLSDRIPSGAYLSTAGDLARFVSGVLALPPATRTLLFTSGKTSAGKETNVGLAWRLATDDRGRAYVHHGGDAVGGRAFVLVYPRENIGVVILGNLSFARIGEKDAQQLAAHFLP
ncbi:MAG: beta-lactamase family protein [Acidobacteria bacterium]|nr:beta-lactamase family protein [Acidobacteriota bacterium]MBV9474516.1 beta-lactamase family protein [Acidobacteriota bacterium]